MEIMYRKFFLYAAVFLFISGLSFALVRGVHTQNAQNEPHKAFMAFQIERRYDATGAERYHEYRTFAVRSDGSSAWFANRPGTVDGQIHGFGAIYDLANQRVTTVDGFTESTITESLAPGQVAFQRKMDHSCQSGTERSTILGQQVVKVTVPVGPTRPGAGLLLAFPYRRLVFRGKPGAKTTLETLYLIPNEPPASLFEVPRNYAERSPSQVADEYARRLGHRPFSDNVLQRAEEKYHARHY